MAFYNLVTLITLASIANVLGTSQEQDGGSYPSSPPSNPYGGGYQPQQPYGGHGYGGQTYGGFGQLFGYGQPSGYGHVGYGAPPVSYGQTGHSHGGYGQTGHSHGGYGQTGHSHGGYGQTGYGQGGYGAYSPYGSPYSFYGQNPYSFGYAEPGVQGYDLAHIVNTINKITQHTNAQNDYKSEALNVKVHWNQQEPNWSVLQQYYGVAPQTYPTPYGHGYYGQTFGGYGQHYGYGQPSGYGHGHSAGGYGHGGYGHPPAYGQSHGSGSDANSGAQDPVASDD